MMCPSAMSPRRWLTCTPKRFIGTERFFARDSGLLCRGFQEIGVECQAVMLGPRMDDDVDGDLIRADLVNLEDVDWWRLQGVEGVVFYGWGSGEYTRIARAIKEAGLLLISHLDAGGVLSVLNGIPEYAGNAWRASNGSHGSRVARVLRVAARVCLAGTWGLVRTDWGRARHLRCADVIGAVSPIAKSRIQRVCRFYGGRALMDRVRLIPHPIAPYMGFDEAVTKERLVVAVGRWCDPPKGGPLLISSLGTLLGSDASVCAEIYGEVSPAMKSWHASLARDHRDRVLLKGVVANKDLPEVYSRASVSLCTSVSESFHIASAEALCCGCSVVGPDVPELPSMKWFTDGPFGAIGERSPEGLTRAVLSELEDWDAGRRDARRISAHWRALLSAPRVAESILELADAEGMEGM